LTGLFK